MLRKKGVFPLPNKLSFSLMGAQDHKHQKKRDDWVAQMLTSQIEGGRVDTLDEGEEYAPDIRRKIQSDKPIIYIKDDSHKLRIDVP